jgi:plasmid maintenance system antidote protein VapI
MKKGSNDSYKVLIAKRIKKIIELSGLELIGFATFVNISESHLYAILNGNREVTEDIAERIGSAFNLNGGKILRLNYKIPKGLKKSQRLNNFYEDNKEVNSYFVGTRSERKDAYYIENDLLRSHIFDKPIYVWELREYCESKGKKYTSKRLSQILDYLVKTKKLQHDKRAIKLRDGGYGTKKVYAYYKK